MYISICKKRALTITFYCSNNAEQNASKILCNIISLLNNKYTFKIKCVFWDSWATSIIAMGHLFR